MKNIFLIILSVIPLLGFGQSQKSLSEILWSRVSHCYSMFEDMDDDGVPDFNKIDDSKNGYLKISGSWPTCGCSCSSTVGAYKNNEGEYIILQSDKELCSWERKISSNKNINEILPIDFGINSFLSEKLEIKYSNPIFFIDVEIPRVGTDTKVKIELVPLGLFPYGDNLICFEYGQNKSCKSLYLFKDIVNKMTDINTLDYLLAGEFEKINTVDNKLIQKGIGTDDSRFDSLNEMQEYLLRVKKVYDIYCKLETKELILGWNRIESRFYIKRKGECIVQVSFIDFLKSSEYWDWMC
ncbi:hypothetical protein [Plebeiibacterium sediminum]|uniref:Uncharacterized protein n=1 Tax=Plebeiibacterium sediminum TaxID=2992112 RepID=A0AAE3MA10_9BACT|nr:hypothetical protein [Plebeiobacterium sediminum]MCW3789702.1 hypothetical protein [Plebeiobacterium sediminum]